MSKFFMFILGVLIVGGIYMWYKGMPQQTSNNAPSQVPSTATPIPLVNPSGEQSKTVPTVEYSSQGFSPQTVTIKSGMTVTWTNKNADGMWVASDPHPTHTDYPGFDALKSIPTDGTYSFTFTKTGTWGYHNHLNPSQKGTVIVQ